MSLESSQPLPSRPRLADHALLRRHLIEGREHLLIIDANTDETLQIEPRILEIILCADGTRDLGGIILASVRRGAYRRASDVVGVLEELHQRELLTDGIEMTPPVNHRRPERPVEPLPGFSLTCDASGSCCGTYSSVVFSSDEAARARALAPNVLASDADGRRGLLPIQSSVPTYASAVTMVDGHCPYLADDGLCRLQLAGGPEAKPRGCRIFPATFVDDGTTIRVSVAVECPCVLKSLGVAEGSPLIPRGATREADLIPGSPIIRLPAEIAVSQERRASRDELRAWSEAVLSVIDGVQDPLAALWGLADSTSTDGLAPRSVEAVLGNAAPPSPMSLGFPLMKLDSQARAKRAALEQLVGERLDRTFELARWISRGTRALLDSSRVADLLEAPASHLDHERFYLRAAFFGHHLITPEMTLEQALRDRALRLLLARQLASDPTEERPNQPAAQFPMTAVESMMRGQGLERYALRS